MRSRWWRSAVWLMSPACAAWWQPADDVEALTAQLHDRVDAATAPFGFDPGLALAVIEDGEVVTTVVEGEFDPRDGTPMTTVLPVPLASTTKLFTAILVLRQVDAGALDLNDDVTDVVPDLPDALDGITVGHLLTHTDGLADGWDAPSFQALDDAARAALTARAYVDHAVQAPPRFPPGKRARYGQTGFVLLSLVVEETTGTPYATALRDGLLDPLGLAATGFANDEVAFAGRTSVVFARDGDGFSEQALDYVPPDISTAALVSSFDDVVTLVRALQRGEVLSPATLEAATDTNAWTDAWGLGFERTRHRGMRLSGHSGGQSTVVELAIGTEAASVFLSTANDPRILDLGYDVAAKAAQWGAR